MRLVAAARAGPKRVPDFVADFSPGSAVASAQTHTDSRRAAGVYWDDRRPATSPVLALVETIGTQRVRDYWVLPSGLSCAFDSPATVRKAANNIGGKSFPRAAARRRIPREAVALKKYRAGRGPVSKVSDNEHAAPSLGNSEELSVKDSPGSSVPELPKTTEEGIKIIGLLGDSSSSFVSRVRLSGSFVIGGGSRTVRRI